MHACIVDLGVECFKPIGAFYVFPQITSTGLTSQEFSMRLLEKTKVACGPGPAFAASGEGFVRCSYATSWSRSKSPCNTSASSLPKCAVEAAALAN